MPRGGRKSRKDDFDKDTTPEKEQGAQAAQQSSDDEADGEGLPKNVAAEIAKLNADNKGMFTLRLKKPNSSFSKKDAENDFGHFGTLADVHFTDNFVYIRYSKHEEAEKAITLMHDTYQIDVPGVSRGWSSKDPEDVSMKVSKLSPDTRGWYSIRIAKPSPQFNEKDIEANFGKYGEISDIHFTEKFIYVRYLSWKEAANAIRGLDSKFVLDIPNVSEHWKQKKSHSDKGPQIYIGNISHRASKEEVSELLERYSPREFKYYSINNKNFAFAYFESPRECKAAVSDLNGKVLRGTTLYVRTCRDRSRARYITEDDYQSKKAPEHRKGVKGNFNATSPFGQGIIELYVSNFSWNIKKEELISLFQPHGQLAYVEVMPLAQKSGECRKAFVGMYEAYEAKQAMHKLNQRTWFGLKLNVAFSHRKPVDSGGHGKHSSGDNSQPDYNSNPVDRAYTISNKLDIMLEDVLDKCDFCVKIHGLVSDLQQAIREIKYQALRGDIIHGLTSLTSIIDQLSDQQQEIQEQPLYGTQQPMYGNQQQMYSNHQMSAMGSNMNNSSMQYRNKLEEFYANGSDVSSQQDQFYGGNRGMGGAMDDGMQYNRMGGMGSNQGGQFLGNGGAGGYGGYGPMVGGSLGGAGRGYHMGRGMGGLGRGRGRGK